MPGERSRLELDHEPHGFWPVITDRGNAQAFLLKTSTQLLKHIIRGDCVQLDIFHANSPIGQIVATCLRVFDQASAPMLIMGVLRHEEEHHALARLLDNGNGPIFLFDELARPIGCMRWAQDVEKRPELREFARCYPSAYVGPWNDHLHHLLDQLTSMIDPAQPPVPPPSEWALLSVPLELSNFVAGRIYAVGSAESVGFEVGVTPEGEGQEQQVWHLLVDLFGERIHYSPQTGVGASKRELCDVLAYTELSNLIVESKALTVLTAPSQQSHERRIQNLRRHISKASVQLVGASRALRRGDGSVYSRSEKQIDLPQRRECVGLIVLSDMPPEVDWCGVAEELLECAKKGDVVLTICDLTELRILVGVSRSPEALIERIKNRSGMMMKHGSALIRTKIVGPPLP